MNLLQVQNGTKAFGDRVLFEDVTFAINSNEHVGVVGPNGAGKSTLFKILIGQDQLDSGELVKSNSLRIGYLGQEDDWNLNSTLRSFLEESCKVPIWELEQLGEGLGLTKEHFETKIAEFSGGFRMRSQLLYVIGNDPNLMLLDEPTNYLDLESLLVLEKFLISYEGAFLLISHDREFLRRVTNQTLEIEYPDVTKFSGGIDDYFDQKEQIRQQIEKQNLSTQAKRKKIMDFVTRFRAKNTKATQAQSKLKSLEKLKVVDIKPLPTKASINIPSPVKTGKIVLKINDVKLGYGEKIVLQDVTLSLSRGDHLGVVGVNGSGKSTLLKGLSETIRPISGDFELGYGVSISYFTQHSADQLKDEDSVYDSLISDAHPDILPQDVLNLAGSLLFSKEDTEKKIKVLSGGEKTRVALGKILLNRSPLLLLDEPTNHLDFSTVESLAQALETYEGTVIVVSHDRAFIDRVSSKILQIKDSLVSLYPGTYQEYLWSVQKGVLAEDSEKESNSEESTNNSNLKNEKLDIKKERKRLKQEILEIGKKIKAVDQEMESNQKILIDTLEQLNSSSGKDATDLHKKCEELNNRATELENSWIALSENLESLEKELSNITYN